MIAYDKAGAVFALREGAELLVHDGESEGPLWRKMLDADIVALGADRTHVAAITSTGTVTWFTATSGDLAGTGRVDGMVQRATFIGASTCIAVTATQIAAIEQTGTTIIAEHSATAVAARPDGGVCVAFEGKLVQYVNGTKSETSYDTSVGAMCWHPGAKFWLVAAGHKLESWNGLVPPAHVTQIPDVTIERVAATEKAVAFAWDKKYVGEMSWPAKETLGDLMYVDKDVEGLDFGPWPWLGVALSEGDANKHNMLEPNRLHRSDTHPGRQHHSWLVRVGAGGDEDDESAPAEAPITTPPPKDNQSVVLGLVMIAIVGFVLYMVLK